MNSIVVIQARTSSSRLPAKVLLPIKQIPMVVLAAKRAATTRRNVLVVTSVDPSDDALCGLLKFYDIKFYRGSLNNTLDRYVSALTDFDDNTIVFRLTADNVFPDGLLIDELERELLDRKLDYLACNGDESGLPYGMSVEVTYLKHLRDANKNTSSAFDLEHVTPYIKRLKGGAYFKKYHSLQKGTYRCTVDTFDDYLAVCTVFDACSKPENIPWLDLVNKLAATQEKPLTSMPINKMILGGVQLGLNYGIANTSGQPSSDVTEALIKRAISAGIEYIDTARAYGNSETVIGQVLSKGWESRVKVITKLSPLSDCPQVADVSIVKAFVEASVYQSMVNLNRKNLDCLMLHRAAHLKDWQGEVWQTLLSMKRQGLIKHLGVSVQHPSELDEVLPNEDIAYIQLPFNIVDTRWFEQIEKIKQIKTHRLLNVHVRSVFLQGLLLSEDEQLWQRANCNPPGTIQAWLNQQVLACERESVTDLCLAYVRSMSWLDGVVIGMENLAQLEENAALFSTSLLSEQQLQGITDGQPEVGDGLLNPANWKTGH
ncbi:MAG: hypothetical protein HOO93_12385 [Methyloglobulus sp.]|nr:hypothetical protein [Methyloglobulus sp.]